VRKHAGRRDPRPRRMAPTLVISPFLPPFSPRSVKRDVPARNDARVRDWCTSSRCLPDPKPRILLPGFAPGAISACPPASDTNRSASTRCPGRTRPRFNLRFSCCCFFSHICIEKSTLTVLSDLFCPF
jgi:hypothetical protein